jgi:hypothetical protein
MFKKGQSGNPSGRPKQMQEITDLARQRAPEAFARIVDLTSNDDPRVALAASQEVLNRAYGKPRQALQHSGPDGGDIKTIVEIRRVIVDTGVPRRDELGED